MTMDRGTAIQPEAGQQIYTSDDEHLGKVKEVRGAYFKVDAAMQLDYWLRADNIRSSAGDRLTVGFEKHQLGGYKVSEPSDVTLAEQQAGSATARASNEGEPAPAYKPTTVPGGLTGFSAGIWDEAHPAYRQEWEQHPDGSGRRWEEVEPGYRYGFEMASDPRYAGRSWPEAEPDLAAGYTVWIVQVGYPEDRTWVEMRGSARESWDRVREDNE